MLWKLVEVREWNVPLVPLVFQWNEMKWGPLLETGDAACNVSVHLLICKYICRPIINMSAHYKYAATLCRQSIIWPIIRIIAIIHEPAAPRTQCQATWRLNAKMMPKPVHWCAGKSVVKSLKINLWSDRDSCQLSMIILSWSSFCARYKDDMLGYHPKSPG